MGTCRICIGRKNGKNKQTQQNPKTDSTSISIRTTLKNHHVHTHFYVNGIPFFLSNTGKLNFLSGINLKSRIEREIKNVIDPNQNKHEQEGFKITDIHSDTKLSIQSLQYFVQTINPHIYAKDEHIGFIQNSIKKIKEISGSMSHTAPYIRYTRLMKKYLAEGVIDILNVFPSKDAISNTMGPAMLV